MYTLNPKLAADLFDNEYIIANLSNGLYYNVLGLAVELLRGLPFEDPASLITILAEAVPEKQAEIREELNHVWEQLLKEEIVSQTSKHLSPGDFQPLISGYTPSRFNRYADMQDLLMLDPIHDVDEEGWAVKQD